jgi:hypothetical protein
MPTCALHCFSPELGSGPNESRPSHVECRALSPSHRSDVNLSITASSPFDDRICLAVTVPIERSAQDLTNSRPSARCHMGSCRAGETAGGFCSILPAWWGVRARPAGRKPCPASAAMSRNDWLQSRRIASSFESLVGRHTNNLRVFHSGFHERCVMPCENPAQT